MKWGQLTPAQSEDTAVPSKDTGRAHRCHSIPDSQLLPAVGRGMLWTSQKLRSCASLSPVPSSSSPDPGYSFPNDLFPLEASVCALQITLSTPSGKIPYFTNLFHCFSNMTNLYSRCGLLNGLKNTHHLLSTYYCSQQPREVGAII